jgi:hypothetical protein
MRGSEIRAYVRFVGLRADYVVTRKICDWAVELHTVLTPTSSTADTLNEIALEQTRRLVRRLEQRAHLLQRRYTEVGNELIDAP